MKRTTFAKIVSTVMIVLLASLLPVGSGADGEMAYNIYADPDLSSTGGSFETFMIDFRATESAPYTYWALANFGMQITPETLKKYPGLCYGGAYAGLQDRGPDLPRAGIMSFWHWEYQENGKMVELNASKLYPNAEDNPFGGEGTGMSSIQPFDWVDNNWYTMVLHTWQDKDTGTTFVGQWFLDQTTGKWTLITYYDTHLINSALNGGMSLFQENYWGISREEERSFNTKGIYVLDKLDGNWKSINSVTISYGDGGAANKLGAHEFGATDEYFWGMAGGSVENQAAYEAAATKYQKYTINQPATPTFDSPAISSLSKNGNTFTWALSEEGTPQLGFTLEILDETGTVVYTAERTRPEQTSFTVDEQLPDEYLYRLTVTDIFGNTTVKENVTDHYLFGNDSLEDLLTEEGIALRDFDTNKDGVIDISDVTALLAYLAGNCGHKEVIVPAVAPTCQEYGYTEGSYCAICNKTLKVQKRIAKLEHKESVIPASPPSCTEEGLTEGKSCLNCGKVYLAQQTVPATGHQIGSLGDCTACDYSIAMTIYRWGIGFENWSEQTQLLIIAPYTEAYGNSLKWEITLDDGTTSKTVSLFPTTSYGGLENNCTLFRFTVCTAIGENRFVPTPGVEYNVIVRTYSGDTLVNVGVPSTGLTWSLDKELTPIVPDEIVEPEPTESWTLSGGVLTILSDDCMNGAELTDYPWYEYRLLITDVIIADGVTKIGNRALSDLPNLRQVVCGKDLSVLSFDSFAHDRNLTTIVFNGTIKTIGQGVVYQTPNIVRITVTGQTKEEFIELSKKSAYNTAFENENIIWTEKE